jgi:hypothetical protein
MLALQQRVVLSSSFFNCERYGVSSLPNGVGNNVLFFLQVLINYYLLGVDVKQGYLAKQGTANLNWFFACSTIGIWKTLNDLIMLSYLLCQNARRQ